MLSRAHDTLTTGFRAAACEASGHSSHVLPVGFDRYVVWCGGQTDSARLADD